MTVAGASSTLSSVSRRPLTLLTLALACALGALAVWLAAFALPLGRRLDGAALDAFGAVARPRLEPSIQGIANLAGPPGLIVIGSSIICIALLRRRWMMAALVPLILLTASLFTHLAKPGLAHPRIVELAGIDAAYPASWPSGHATVAMSLALCAVLVAGPRLRPVAAALGAAYAIGVGYSLVVLGWHLPSDVLGGFLVAATFALLGAAALAQLEQKQEQEQPRQAAAGAAETHAGPLCFGVPSALVRPGLTALTTLVLCGVAVLARHPNATGQVGANPAAVLAAAAIAVLGVTLTASLTLALRSDR